MRANKPELFHNYPNPFNPSTAIEYFLHVPSRVTLNVYDAIGRTVGTVSEGNEERGWYMVNWNGVGNSGRQAASGVYFYKLSGVSSASGTGFSIVKKMVIVR
jgi:flagellar hook assembly protein FlgD